MGREITRTEYYLEIAAAVSKKSHCKRRKYGAIVVVNDSIVSTGYNGPARGSTNCETGCIKDLLGLPHSEAYEPCPAVHAEENCVVNAARSGSKVLGGTMYISGFDAKTGEKVEASPCKRCRRIIINAGIEKVVIDSPHGHIEIDVREWVREDKGGYEENYKKFSKELYG